MQSYDLCIHPSSPAYIIDIYINYMLCYDVSHGIYGMLRVNIAKETEDLQLRRTLE